MGERFGHCFTKGTVSRVSLTSPLISTQLNTSYGKRTSDLVAARERIATLEAELEDAWKMAEKMAVEMDELDAVIASDDEGDFDEEPLDEGTTVIKTVQVHDVSEPPPLNRARLSGTILNIAPQSPTSPKPPPSVSSLPSLPPSIEAPAPSASPVPPRPPSKDAIALAKEVFTPTSDVMSPATDRSDAMSTRTRRSTRSIKSYRSSRSVATFDTTTSHVNYISAARRRSVRTSLASLRLPKRLASASYDDEHPLPPVPTIPSAYMSPNYPPSSYLSPSRPPSAFPSAIASSFLYSESNTSLGKPRSTLDDIEIDIPFPRDRRRVSPRPGSAMDDLHVMPSTRGSWTDEIEVVPRTPTFRRSVDDITMLASTLRLPPGMPPSFSLIFII